jgi:hypothetical protein
MNIKAYEVYEITEKAFGKYVLQVGVNLSTLVYSEGVSTVVTITDLMPEPWQFYIQSTLVPEPF